MPTSLNRRRFIQATVLASAAPAALGAESPAAGSAPAAAAPFGPQVDNLPTGKLKGLELSRLMLGGNLISGYAHARDLSYVSPLMKRYNTDAKIAETLELAETHGINVINSWVMDGVKHLQQHWKRGGKMKWISQVRVGQNGEFDQVNMAIDAGAVAVHPTGDTSDALVREGRVDTIAKMLDLIHSKQCIAGVGAHGLASLMECEKAGIKADFYIKTLHSHEYHTAPKAGETDDLGRYDNSWCSDPEAVIDFMFTVKKPWIAFKVLAAGAIPPPRGFRYAFEGGADFVLAGMFDWQVAENVRTAKEVLGSINRLRPWLA